MTTITYIEPVEVAEVKLTPTPIFRSASGYGRKIPTRYMVRIGSRWYRVYCICFSNCGSLYILRNGEMLFATRIEYLLEDARDSQAVCHA